MPKVLRIGQILISEEKDVYVPGEDTFFLEDAIRDLSEEFLTQTRSALEIGTGSGYISVVLWQILPKSAKIIASDITDQSINSTRRTLELNGVFNNVSVLKSDLFNEIALRAKKNENGIRESKIDLIVFNPPYLPDSTKENPLDALEHAWSGRNETGDEIILKFFQQVRDWGNALLSNDCKIIIVLSSYNTMARQWLRENTNILKTLLTKERRSSILGESLCVVVAEYKSSKSSQKDP